MQAGKDVYVEKPASHVFREGRLLVDAARKYNRIVQHGTQMRSSDVTKQADKLLKEGVIGAVKMSKAWNCQRHTHRQPVADGPRAGRRELRHVAGAGEGTRLQQTTASTGAGPGTANTATATSATDGIHDLDLARWGLGVETHPNRITAHGSRIDLVGEREYPDNMMGVLPLRRRQSPHV